MTKIRALEITFGAEVEITNKNLQDLELILADIAERYEAAHPGRIMWSFGQGSKMLINPLMLSDDEPIPFDDSTYHIEMAEREGYPEELERRKRRGT